MKRITSNFKEILGKKTLNFCFCFLTFGKSMYEMFLVLNSLLFVPFLSVVSLLLAAKEENKESL